MRWRFARYPNVPYDGQFTLVRVSYARYGGWAADYPLMERNLSRILQDVTALKPHTTGSNVHTFDDPELLRYPIAYLSEPGYRYPTDSELAGLRHYLDKVPADWARWGASVSSSACTATATRRASSR